MTYFYTSSPRSPLTQEQARTLTNYEDPKTLAKLAPTLAALKQYDPVKNSLQLHRLKMTFIEQIWTSISLLFLTPLSYIFQGLADKVSEYRSGFWLVYSVVPLAAREAPSVVAAAAVARAAGLTPPPKEVGTSRPHPAAGTGLPPLVVPTPSTPAAPRTSTAGGAVAAPLYPSAAPAPSAPTIPLVAPTASAASGGGGAAGAIARPQTAIQQILTSGNLFDRDLQISLFAELAEGKLKKAEAEALIRLISAQVPEKIAELTALFGEEDSNRFLANVPRMRELFTHLFNLLYLTASDVESKKEEDIRNRDAFLFRENAFRSKALYQYLDRVHDLDPSIDFPGIALPHFAKMAEAFSKLSLSRQMLVDAEYACCLLESEIPNFSPDRRSGRPLADADSQARNVGFALLTCLQQTSPYVAGRYYLQAAVTDKTDLVEATEGIIGEVPETLKTGAKYREVSRYFAEIKRGYEAFLTISYFGIRIRDWPDDIPNHVRALFDNENKTNLVTEPSFQEIETGAGWHRVRVPQEKSTYNTNIVGRQCSAASMGIFFDRYPQIGEASAIGYALLAPLARGSTTEIESGLDRLQRSDLDRIGITRSPEAYFARLFRADSPLSQLLAPRTDLQTRGLQQKIRDSFLAAQKAKQYLASALASKKTLEKLLVDRNFLKHLYLYLWFLSSLSSLPTLSELETAPRVLAEENPLTDKCNKLISFYSSLHDMINLEGRPLAGKSILSVGSPTAINTDAMASHYVVLKDSQNIVSIALPAGS